MLRTENCVICGKKAIGWRGCVIGSKRYALGNLMPVKVAAGRCSEHEEVEIETEMKYDPDRDGVCVPLFSK